MREVVDDVVRQVVDLQMRYQKVDQLQRQEKGAGQREKESGQQEKGKEGGLAEETEEALTGTLQLIDTTLLKCYIKVGVAKWWVWPSGGCGWLEIPCGG